jgi:hypothetical protein
MSFGGAYIILVGHMIITYEEPKKYLTVLAKKEA